MSKIQKIVGVGVLVAVVIAIGVSYPKIQQSVPQVLGNIPGPDIYLPYINLNGVQIWSTRQALALATTTPCAIKSPAATSTLEYASAMVTVASSTATTWTVAKATTAFATTTKLGTFSLSSAVQGTMVASTTPVSGSALAVDEINTFAPNTYIVWSKAGDTPAGTGLAGFCSAQFKVI